MIEAILIFIALAVIFGLLLGYASIKFKVEGNPVADQIRLIKSCHKHSVASAATLVAALMPMLWQMVKPK